MPIPRSGLRLAEHGGGDEEAGVDHVYVEVPGGNHTDIAVPNLAPMFDFFNSKRKGAVEHSRRQ